MNTNVALSRSHFTKPGVPEVEISCLFALAGHNEIAFTPRVILLGVRFPTYFTHPLRLTHVRYKEITPEERKIIIKLRNEGKILREIGKIVGRTHSSIQRVINNYTSSKSIISKARSGRPSKLTAVKEICLQVLSTLQEAMSYAIKNQTNPLTITATGYAPYIETRVSLHFCNKSFID
ncbi:hypothetical protein CEXT_629831 [Caerostris extrusa]|uniref:Transposase IS30-like HTH domain-containing protein n=1 Tax=Caerostris extrusa TaxID=172846 RepID=A0AAV4NGM2_CAEEX|nr:hypothetical protein CEXT_629831 [Caerostris extrusa]